MHEWRLHVGSRQGWAEGGQRQSTLAASSLTGAEGGNLAAAVHLQRGPALGVRVGELLPPVWPPLHYDAVAVV